MAKRPYSLADGRKYETLERAILFADKMRIKMRSSLPEYIWRDNEPYYVLLPDGTQGLWNQPGGITEADLRERGFAGGSDGGSGSRGATVITLPDGRMFPAYDNEPLSWDVGVYFTLNEERQGYPRLRTVLAAMREYRPDQLEREKRELLKGTFDKVFGHNARKLLALIEKTEDERLT